MSGETILVTFVVAMKKKIAKESSNGKKGLFGFSLEGTVYCDGKTWQQEHGAASAVRDQRETNVDALLTVSFLFSLKP